MIRSLRNTPISVCCILALASSPVCLAEGDAPSGPRTFNPRTLMPPLPPITDAPVIAAGDVTDQISDNELVIGVVVNGEARAYSINTLTGPKREIINDTLGGRAIAATW